MGEFRLRVTFLRLLRQQALEASDIASANGNNEGADLSLQQKKDPLSSLWPQHDGNFILCRLCNASRTAHIPAAGVA
jgi:hypothetical protein